MDNKKLGLILFGIGIIFLVSLIVFKIQINSLTDAIMIATGGKCITETGTCIHEQSNIPVYIGVAIIVFTFALGVYLIFFERSQKEIIKTLQETRKEQELSEKFRYLLKGLSEYEKKVIMAVKEQDGIKQNTLRIRTDMSKAKLSLVLSDLEKKNLVKKVPDGKTNKVYLKSAL